MSDIAVATPVMAPASAPTYAPVRSGTVQRCGGTACAGSCDHDDRDGVVQRFSSGTTAHEDVPASVYRTLASRGRPLDGGTRAAMEARFEYDFSHVRVHDDTHASASARSIGALAYTVGPDIAFSAGQYRPHSDCGRRLLAHELAHVVQQGGRPHRGALRLGPAQDAAEHAADAAAGGSALATGTATDATSIVRRVCGPTAIGTPAGCALSPGFGQMPAGTIFRFDKDCDDFAPGEQTRFESFAAALPLGATFQLHGCASADAAVTFNNNLSCARAVKARAVALAPGPPRAALTGVFSHGGVPGPIADARSVVVSVQTRTEPESEPKPNCGPDATDWFVRQMNAAVTDPAVLAVQLDMRIADLHARVLGTTAAQVSEGGAAKVVELQEFRLGTTAPPRTADASAQIAAGNVSGALATGAIKGASVFALPSLPLMLVHLNLVRTGWTALVNHAARYDFKAHSDSMNHPRSTNCPQDGCPPGEVGIITLCPGATAENCYESDLPGNLFYARIGRFVGFSELTLQLGSQFAELTDTGVRPFHPAVTWDSPEDTAAIRLGFGLPLPLTRAALCGAVPPLRASLSVRTGCDDCTDVTPSIIR